MKLKQIVAFADEQYKKGDYYYALDYYKQALAQDSNNLELLWKYAETQRAYKDYVQAEKYYGIVYARDVDSKFPASILYYGLMQKQNGNYTRAFETFKLAKRKFEEDKDQYLFKKANQEVEACAWAIKNYSDTITPMKHLPLTVNSYDAEFAHTVRDNKLIFSSLKPDSVKENNQEVYSKTYKTRIYSSDLSNGEFGKYKRVDDLFNQKMNAGNGTFSLDGKRFYFSLCQDEGYNYKCKIMVANYENGKWSKIDSLKREINNNGSNNTMPYVTRLNEEEVLFFASDREGSKGGLDIWYAKIEKDNKFGEVTNAGVVNSIDNELTPWFDTIQNRLYFSSAWHYGFGGQDVFYAPYNGKKFGNPVNAGLPINSQANDQYFFKHQDTAYVSSNRIGSYYAKNPTCCSDIFAIYPPIKIKKNDEIVENKKEKIVETENQKRIKERLPVTIYFRNDEPDASSYSTTTKQNYINTYKLYTERYILYKTEVAKGLSPELATQKQQDLDLFFKNNVDKGANDLLYLTELIKKELESGSVVTLTIKGFASPVAKTDYNVNLTKRRISSLTNYFNEYNNGELKDYIKGTSSTGGKLLFAIAPFGEYTADQKTSDNVKDQSNSVYSKEAGIERKIQIENVSFDKGEKPFPIESLKPVFTAGEVKKGDQISGEFLVTNTSNEKINIEIINEDPNLKVETKTFEIAAKSNIKLNFVVSTESLTGLTSNKFKVKVKGFEDNLEFFVTSEIK